MTNKVENYFSNIYIRYNSKQNLVVFELLYDHGNSFILNLNDKDDLEEFQSLMEFLIIKEDKMSLENCTSTLSLEWTNKTLLHIKHGTTEDINTFNEAIAVLNSDDVTILKNTLMKIDTLRYNK